MPPQAAAKLRIENVALRFVPKTGAPVVALENISLDVADNEFSVIVGPSGCGKTSLLRLVAGLIEPSGGAIWLNNQRVTGPGRDRGMVFQSYTLFPWLTVQRNVEFGLKLRGIAPEERRDVARRFLVQVGLDGFENHYPKQLSGGMMQRVALARALANDPAVLLMDEPFGALDSQTRSLMQELLLEIWQHSSKTVLFITHDIDEFDPARRSGLCDDRTPGTYQGDGGDRSAPAALCRCADQRDVHGAEAAHHALDPRRGGAQFRGLTVPGGSPRATWVIMLTIPTGCAITQEWGRPNKAGPGSLPAHHDNLDLHGQDDQNHRQEPEMQRHLVLLGIGPALSPAARSDAGQSTLAGVIFYRQNGTPGLTAIITDIHR